MPSIEPKEYKTLCAFYGFETIHAILNAGDEKNLQLAKEYRLTEYQGKKFISLGRKIAVQGE